MKALSLWQPWASLMMTDAKRFETRSWPTKYRGPLVICSAKHKLSLDEEIKYRSALWSREYNRHFGHTKPNDLPLGMALGIVMVYDCVKTELLTFQELNREVHFGNYAPGRYAWKTHLVEVFEKPFPVKGRQGLFNITI